MTLIFEIIGGFILYVLVLAFFPLIMLGFIILLCVVMIWYPGEPALVRGLAALGAFVTAWVTWKVGETYLNPVGK